MKKVLKPAFIAGAIACTLLIQACTKTDLTETPNNVNTASGLTVAEETGNNARTEFRPIEDYLSAQGRTSLYVIPVPDFLGWGSPIGDGLTRWLSIDYNGTSANYLNTHGLVHPLPTTVSGTIKETLTNDGRAKVTITVHAEDALTFTFTTSDPSPDFLTEPLDFGYRPHELLANANLDPALGSSDLSITFYNPYIGAPIPDLIDLFNNRVQDVLSFTLKTTSTGVFHALSGFPEGAEGTVVNHQIGQVFKYFDGAVKNDNSAFPQERITYSLN